MDPYRAGTMVATPKFIYLNARPVYDGTIIDDTKGHVV